MAVIRINKTGDYTVMSNAHFKEKDMSLKAKGLLSLMLSLPDEWNYSIAGLVTLSSDGKDSVMNGLTELEKFGYLKRTKLKNANGTFAGYDYDVYEKPFAVQPYAENPNTEKPNTENPPQLSTKELNTKKSSIKESNTKEKGIDYVGIANAFKEICTSYPAIRHLSEARKKAIKARINAGYTQDDFITLFKTAQQSDFLKGKNDRHWKADFDWLIKDANMAKVLDGKYNNKTEPKSEAYNYSYGQEGVDYL